MTTNLPMLPYFMPLVEVCGECNQAIEKGKNYRQHIDGHILEFKDRQTIAKLKINWREYTWQEYKGRKHGQKT